MSILSIAPPLPSALLTSYCCCIEWIIQTLSRSTHQPIRRLDCWTLTNKRRGKCKCLESIKCLALQIVYHQNTAWGGATLTGSDNWTRQMRSIPHQTQIIITIITIVSNINDRHTLIPDKTQHARIRADGTQVGSAEVISMIHGKISILSFLWNLRPVKDVILSPFTQHSSPYFNQSRARHSGCLVVSHDYQINRCASILSGMAHCQCQDRERGRFTVTMSEYCLIVDCVPGVGMGISHHIIYFCPFLALVILLNHNFGTKR